MAKDDIKSLYDGLISKGYTTSDLGDENTFREKMQDKNNRKELYDYVSGRNDFRIGDYDSYEKRLSSNYAPVQSSRENDNRGNGELDSPGMADLYEQLQRIKPKNPTLRELVETESNTSDATPNQLPDFTLPSDNTQVRNGFRKQAELQGQLQRINDNLIENQRVNRQYTPKEENTEQDVLLNYKNRFALTERGKELQDEYAGIQGEITKKYMDEFMKSPEYQGIAGKKYNTQQEADQASQELNNMFLQKYGERISQDMEPYDDAIFNELQERYGAEMQSGFTRIAKKNTKESVDSLQKELEELSDSYDRKVRSHAPVGSNAMNALMGSTRYNQLAGEDRKQRAMIDAAKGLLENSQNIIDEASKKGNTNFVAGFGRGLRDSFNADNWTSGFSELSKNMNLNQVLDKADKGEKLTDSEQALLDALVTNMAVNAYYSSDLGRGYQAGQTTGASIPFMLEFAVNPVSASGSGIAKSILRYGARRFGLAGTRGAARKAALSGARLVGDAAAAAAMTGTTGLPGVLADTQQRMMGDVNPVFNEEGRAEYGGRQNQQGLGEAIGKSVASRFLENQSEMVFNAFPGIGNRIAEAIPGGMPSIIQRFGQTRIGQSVRDLYKGLKNNELVRDIAQRTQFHGLGEEYLEEVYNNFANIPLGDMTFEDAVSLDQNINTLLGLAPTSVAFSMIGLGGLARERYNNRRNMQRIFGRMTPDQQRMFNELQEMSRQNGNEDIKRFIKATIEDPELTAEQKKEEIQYAWEIARNNAIEDVQEEETQEQVDAENADIDAHTDPKNGLYTEMDRIVINDRGEQVRVPGYKTGEIGGAPVWVPEGAEITPANTVVLKPGEWDESTVRSMPADEVKSENEAMIREDVQARAEQESTYSPDIPPLQVGLTFSDGTDRYEVIQQNPDGGWIAQKTSVDEKGKETQSIVPIDELSYRNIAQANIDAQESAQNATNVSENTQENANSPSGRQSNVSETSVQQPVQPVQEQAQQEQATIPVDEQGNFLYYRAPVDVTLQSIADEQLEPEEVDAFIAANQAEADKNLKKIQDKAPKMGTNIAAYKKAKSEWQEKVADAQAQSDYWKQVKDELTAMRTRPGDTTAQDIAQLGEPLNGDELAAMMLGNGSLPLLRESYMKELGAGNREAQGMFGLFASRDKGGMTIEEAGERLMEADRENGTNFFDQNDPNAGRNAIIDVLSSAKTKGDLTGFIRNNRERIAEQERQAEYAAYEQWCEDNFHMTPEEYESYVERMERENPFEGVDISELDAIFAEAAEEYQNYLNQQENGREAEEIGNAERGNYVLPEEQPDNEGGNSEVSGTAPAEEVGSEVAGNDGVAQGGESGEERELDNNGIKELSSQQNQLNDTSNEQGEVERISGEGSGFNGENEAASILRTTSYRPTAQDGREGRPKESILRDVVQRSNERKTQERLTREDALSIISNMEENAEIAPEIELTIENWDAEFGENGIVHTPIGDVKMGENQFTKMMRQGREGKLGMIKPTLENPDIIIEDSSNAKEGDITERGSSYVYVKAFVKPDGSRYYYFTSVTVSKDGHEVVISNQEKRRNVLTNLLMKGKLVWKHADDVSATSDVADGLYSSQGNMSDPTTEGTDAPQTNSSEGKDTNNSSENQASTTFVAPERQEGENILDYAERVVKSKEIDDARKEVETNPTEAQKEAGNYKKGHVKLDGYDITIENPKGSTRSGVDANGQPWSVTMNNDYGYIKGTEGVDGDHIDVFLSDNPTTGNVYVVDQVNGDGSFDEHKVMYGFSSADEARDAYLANYSPGWKGLGTISEVSKDEFKKWIDSSHRKTKPFAEYKSVKVEGVQNENKKASPHLLPQNLVQAYEEGDTSKIQEAEKALRDYIESQTDYKTVAITYFQAKDNTRKIADKKSPQYKTNRLIAESCKAAFEKAKLNPAILHNEGARRKLAEETTDEQTLEIMSADPSYDVLRAVIRNPHTSDAVLKGFTERFQNNGLDYEAQQVLDERRENGDILFRKGDNERELIGVHNLSEESLRKAFELGGFPMPSIAVTKAEVGHTSFGDISLVFDKQSINPTDRRNKVYGEDAWTPTFPQTGYKLNDDKTSDIYRRAYKVGDLPFFRPANFHTDNYERYINGLGSESLVEHFKEDYGAKQFFLSETGNAVKEYEQHEVNKYLPGQVALYEKVLEGIGIERLKNESIETLRNEVKQFIEQHYGIDLDSVKPFRAYTRIASTISHVIDYAENGNREMKYDPEATKQKIDERIDETQFEGWLKDLFAGVVEKQGIRNERDLFTPSGNRRKWEQLYDEVTLDNVVRAMQRQSEKGGNGLFGGSIFGAAQKEFKSIDEIRNEARERIRMLDDAEAEAARKAITGRLSAIDIPMSREKSFGDSMDMVENITEAVSKSHTPKGIYKYLHDIYPGMTMDIANEIADIVKDIQRMSARYFEAKPRRAVGFDEVKLAVVPSDTDAELIKRLKEQGIPVVTYKRGNDEQRRRIVAKETEEHGLRFRFIGEQGAARLEGTEEVNRRFNEELERYQRGEMDKNEMFHLGNPNGVMRMFLPDLPIVMRSRIINKATNTKHNVDVSELVDLPQMLSQPIFIFKRSDNALGVLTEIKDRNGLNVCVAIELHKTIQSGGDFLEVNDIRSIHGRNSENLIKPIVHNNTLVYADKEKGLAWLSSASSNYQQEIDKQDLNTATNIVKNFENPQIQEENLREGTVTDNDISNEDERKRMVERVQELADSLHLDNVDIVTDTSTLEGMRKRAKGFYSRSTRRITIVIPNQSSVFDAEQTLLHEAVAHYGLRQLFGEHFDTFLENVHRNADEEIQRKIVGLAQRNGWDIATATEEYLASLAEDTNFDDISASWWNKIKELFLRMLHKIGFKDFDGVTLSDNELRYILWRSYENLKEPGRYRSILGEAADIAKQNELKVGNYAQSAEGIGNVADDYLYRTESNTKEADEGGSAENKKNDTPLEDSIVQAWDNMAGSLRFQLRETAVDYLTAVDKFQELISKHSGKEIKPFENAYHSMLALSSKNKVEMDWFDSFVATPLNKAIMKLAGESKTKGKWSWDKEPLRSLVMYVEAKSGIERNRQMAVEKLAGEDKNGDSILNDWNEAKKRINGNNDLSWSEKQSLLDEEAANLGADTSIDYSGLSSVFGDKKKYRKGWKEASKVFVESYENSHEKEDVDNLWTAISNATDFSLRKQYETGLVSREYVERQKERFDNYIPFRGFADEVAGDVYNYIGNDFYPGGNPVKKAKGRKSEAGNPFGSILNIAYSSISVGNKNLSKMALYSLVVNHDTGGLAVTNRAWMVKYDELMTNKELSRLLVVPRINVGEKAPEWVEAVPNLKKTDGSGNEVEISAKEISEIMEDFESLMRKYEKSDLTKPIGKKSKVAYKTLYKERNQHKIPIYIGGDKYTITITGNPRVAQAMNGLLNPDVNNDALTEIGKKVQRFMGSAFTARNAAFSFANLLKDTMYANNQAFIRENPRYWLKFTKNQKAGFGDFIPMMKRLKRYQEGKLNTENKEDRLFKEFMDNGGATGYTFINTQEEYAKEIAKKVKALSRKSPELFTPKGLFNLTFDMIEFTGQSAELINRFAAYKTSREMGRSVSRSVIDAKEITVNFNRKGAGRKSADKNKEWYSPINLASAISQYGCTSILFWNANMQGKYRLYKNITEHPVKTGATLIAGNMVLGAVLVPFMNNFVLPALYDALGLGSGDDDEDYYDVLTDWERTHNICVRLPKGNWLKVPLSPEFVPWYGMGDMINGSISGRRDVSPSDYIKSLVDVVSPININWEYKGSQIGLNFIPTIGQPMLQNMMNVNFMGNPLYKTPFNAKQGFTPQYQMVYSSESPTLIELSRLSNRLGGGSDSKSSGNWSDWNPALLRNLISGYAGGYGTTMLSLADWIVGTSKGEKQAVTFSKMPLVSRFMIGGNKDVKLRRINSSFYKVRDFINEYEYDMGTYGKLIDEAIDKGDLLKEAEYIDELNRLNTEERERKYIILKDIDDAVKSYEEYLKDFPDDEETKNLLYEIKMEGIEELRK